MGWIKFPAFAIINLIKVITPVTKSDNSFHAKVTRIEMEINLEIFNFIFDRVKSSVFYHISAIERTILFS